MNGRLKYLGALAALALAVLVAAPVDAASFDVAFYELTEQMTFDGVTRTGAGALAGSAQAGTPLCPQVLVDFGAVPPGTSCYVQANGSDTIDAATGAGTLTAEQVFVTVQGDNPVDAPEFVVMTGHISGGLQVIDPQGRLIMIWGTFTPDTVLGYPATAFGLGPADFSGTVRLPFARGSNGEHRKARRNEPAFYLGDDGRVFPLARNEYSLGRGTARFELNF